MPFLTLHKRLITLFLIGLLSLVPLAVSASEIGQRDMFTITKITDGDSLRAGDIRIRLHGIDAPEIKQLCSHKGPYPCGRQSHQFLVDMLGSGAELICDHLDTDRYGRLVMRCYHRGLDIAAAMVRSGWALAYRRYASDYIADEADAKRHKRGMWAGEFQTPEAWRRAQ